MTMFEKVWSSVLFACSVHNVNPPSNGKVLVVSMVLSSHARDRLLSILDFFSCFLVLNQKKDFFIIFDVVRSYGVLSLCVTLGIVVKCHYLP